MRGDAGDALKVADEFKTRSREMTRLVTMCIEAGENFHIAKDSNGLNIIWIKGLHHHEWFRNVVGVKIESRRDGLIDLKLSPELSENIIHYGSSRYFTSIGERNYAKAKQQSEQAVFGVHD